MCKLLFISSIKHLNLSENDPKFLKLCGIMEKGQKDGLGYFSSSGMIKAASFKDIQKENGVFDFTERKKVIREWNDPLVTENSLVIHSRTSTNAYGAEAAHPFNIDNAGNFFAHNGVVSVPKKHDFPVKTNNDSEYLGYLYHRGGQEALKNVQGYFAFMTYENNGFTIVRDNQATLFASRMTGTYQNIEESGSSMRGFSIDVITTVEKDLQEIANALDLEFTTPEKVKPFTAIRYKNGEFASYETLDLSEQKLIKDESYHKSIGKLGQGDYDGYNDDSLAISATLSGADQFDAGYRDGYDDALGNNLPKKYFQDPDYADGYQEGYADGYDDLFKEETRK